MAGYRLVITAPDRAGSPMPHAADIVGAFASIAEIETRRDKWNYSMFVYRGIRPKPTFSKSERAWKATFDATELSITLNNGATNKRGVVYVPFVHLAGRPKSDKLVNYVREHLRANVGPRALRALIHDMIKSATRVTTREIKVS